MQCRSQLSDLREADRKGRNVFVSPHRRNIPAILNPFRRPVIRLCHVLVCQLQQRSDSRSGSDRRRLAHQLLERLYQ